MVSNCPRLNSKSMSGRNRVKSGHSAHTYVHPSSEYFSAPGDFRDLRHLIPDPLPGSTFEGAYRFSVHCAHVYTCSHMWAHRYTHAPVSALMPYTPSLAAAGIYFSIPGIQGSILDPASYFSQPQPEPSKQTRYLGQDKVWSHWSCPPCSQLNWVCGGGDKMAE